MERERRTAPKPKGCQVHGSDIRVLVAQDRIHIDHFARQPDDRWNLTAYEGLDEQIECPVLGCSIPMAEVETNIKSDIPASSRSDANSA